MISKLTKYILDGETTYSLRDFNKDLMARILNDDELNKNVDLHSDIYMHIIYKFARGNKNKPIIDLFNNETGLNLSEEDIRFHISRVKSNYWEFIEILHAIFDAKKNDFKRLGASAEEAYYCHEDWIESQFK